MLLTKSRSPSGKSVTKEARYIFSDIGQNSNKFWTITVHSDNTCVTRWGRVGESGSEKDFTFGSPAEAEQFFDRKCREKEGKGYTPLRTVGNAVGAQTALAEAAFDQMRPDCPETERLIARLVRSNVHSILSGTALKYDESKGTFSTPLGVVTKDAILEARSLLSEIGEYVQTESHDSAAFADALNSYLRLIPQAIGRAKPEPRKLYPDLDAVQAQNTILDNLDASLQVVAAASPSAAPLPQLFDARLEHVKDQAVIEGLRRRFHKTAQDMHACRNLDVRRVFRVEIAAMRTAFEKKARKLGNVQELWHGTRVGNVLSILKSGFVIPPVNTPHVTGRMFGNGIYFSDQSTKSLNYSYGYWGGGPRQSCCYMFLCRVALGRTYTPNGISTWRLLFGYDSIHAKAGISGVVNNEMVVFKSWQVDPIFLLEFAPNGA